MNRLLISLIALSAAALAAEPPPEPDVEAQLLALLGTPVTVASKIASTVATAPSVVSVVTAEEIQRMGYRTVWEALRSVPGVAIDQGAFQRPRIVMRGSDSIVNEKVLVLVNGQSSFSFAVGDGNFEPWASIPVDNIASIEVIRGPGSALYGAGGFSGVINIKTVTAADGGSATLRGGQGQGSGAVTFAGTWAGLGLSLSAYHGQDRGRNQLVPADNQPLVPIFPHGPTPAEVRDPQLVDEASLAVTGGGFRLNALDYQAKTPGYLSWSAVQLPGDPYNHCESGIRSVDVQWDWPVTEQLTLTPGCSHTVGFDAHQAKLYNGLQAAGYRPDFYGAPHTYARTDAGQLFANWTPLATFNLIAGVSDSCENVYNVFDQATFNPATLAPNPGGFGFWPNSFEDTGVLHDLGLVLQAFWKIDGNWSVLAGARHDRFAGQTLTIPSIRYATTKPRLVLVYQSANGTVIKLMSNGAMKIPNMGELTTRNNPVLQGNPGLTPESILTVELAISHSFTRAVLSANVYQGRITNLIAGFAVGPGQPSAIRNQGTLDLSGAEIEGKLFLTRHLNLSANWSHCDAHDDATGIAEAGISKDQGRLAVAWDLGQLGLGAEALYQGPAPQQPGIPAPWDVPFGGHTLVNLNLAWRLRPAASLALGCRNLFDKTYDDPSGSIWILPAGYPERGRELFAEARLRF
jgi:iron complex outermembrane receptor protein